VTMFGGYADVYVSQYYMSGGGNESRPGMGTPLPSCYAPASELTDPWNLTSATPKDFILIAEFSELEGPKPLITIPRRTSVSYDLNAFSLRIMSVDHQSSNESFKILDDTHMILAENDDGVYAYVHHFTLYDVHARGFVRPFCMAYVTPCQHKLMTFYNEMTSEFSKVSRLFHYGNLLFFIKDMTHYLIDLEFTREKFIEREKYRDRHDGDTLLTKSEDKEENDEVILDSLSLGVITSCIEEVKSIIEKINELLTDRRLEERFQQLELRSCDSPSSQDTLTPLTSSLNHFNSSTEINLTSPNLSHKLRRVGSSSDVPVKCADDVTSGAYRPKLVRTLNRRCFDRTLRTLHQLCQWGAKEGLTRLRSIHRYFSRDLPTLEIERSDSHLIEPSSSVLTIGRSVMANFTCGMRKDEEQFVSSQFPEADDLSWRWVSDDTMASFQSANSCLSSSDLSTEAAFVMGSAYIGTRSRRSSYDVISLDSIDGAVSRSCAFTVGSAHSSPRLRHSPLNGECSSGPASASTSAYGSPQSCPPHLVLPSSEPSDELLTDLSEDIFQRIYLKRSLSEGVQQVAITSAADHVTRLRVNIPGHAILRLVDMFAFSVHIMFGLLIGRPLIVIGTSKYEKFIKDVVMALTLFVPGHSNHGQQVMNWQTQPLRLVDLSKQKIVGFCRHERKTAIPSYIKPYVSIFDVEKKMYTGPSYQGGLLNTIYNKRKTMKSDKTYVAFIHSILQELTNKAILFYHAFKVDAKCSSIQRKSSEWSSPEFSVETSKLWQDFMNKLKLSHSDAQIVQYMCEVVKMQQVDEIHYDETAPNDIPYPPLRLSHCKTSVFKS